MKKIFILLTSLVFLCSCDETVDPILYDTVNGQTGVSFLNSFTSVIVPEAGVTVSVPVQVTTISNVDRSISVQVNSASTGTNADYSVGDIVIPANAYEGDLNVSFGNFENLEDLMTFELILDLALEDDQVAVGNTSTTFNYLKKVICNDLLLVINEDAYGSERDWEITDASGAIVVSCADFGCPFNDVTGGEQNQAMFTLPNGTYTFTIYDAFGDGLFDGTITGNYKLTCSVITHAQGEGNFGASESTIFVVNE